MRRALSLGLTVGLSQGCNGHNCEAMLWWVDEGQATDVAVVGDWNGWSQEPLRRRAEGVWSLELELEPGDYDYLLLVDGEPAVDPFAALRSVSDVTEVTGGEVSRLRVEDCAAPGWTLVSSETPADGALEVEAELSGWRGLEVEARLLRGRTEVDAEMTQRRGSVTVRADGLVSGRYTLILDAVEAGEVHASLRLPLWVEDQPFSWEGALIYQVVTDRFASSAGPMAWIPETIARRNGGDLTGLTSKIEEGYFEELGVSALWISPVYTNPEGLWETRDGQLMEGYHGYWPVSSEVDPRLGAEADLVALLDTAHEHGLRVMFDVVPNHVHEQHAWRLEHQGDGWFHEDADCVCGTETCPWHTDIETCWFADYLPDLALEDNEVAAAVMDETVGFATRYDVDGLRVDAVPMMPRSAVRELVYRLRGAVEGGLFTLGETFTGADGAEQIAWNLGPHGLSGQFDFPAMWAIRGFAAWGTADAAALIAAIAETQAATAGSGAVLSPFVGNHDVPRFLSEAAGQDTSDGWSSPPAQPETEEPYRRLVLAQALALTLPGAPVLYYGDELGLAGAGDPDCRRPMVFGDDRTEWQVWTQERVARLGRARACSAALRQGRWLPLLADGDAVAWARDAGDGAPAILVANAGSGDRSVELPGTAGNGRYIDIIEGEDDLELVEGQAQRLSVPALSARLYLPEGSDCDLDTLGGGR